MGKETEKGSQVGKVGRESRKGSGNCSWQGKMRGEVGKKGGNGKGEGKWEREAESKRAREDKKVRWKCKVGR
jgi:hypothetical protein